MRFVFGDGSSVALVGDFTQEEALGIRAMAGVGREDFTRATNDERARLFTAFAVVAWARAGRVPDFGAMGTPTRVLTDDGRLMAELPRNERRRPWHKNS
jgi:hypothetical protein